MPGNQLGLCHPTPNGSGRKKGSLQSTEPALSCADSSRLQIGERLQNSRSINQQLDQFRRLGEVDHRVTLLNERVVRVADYHSRRRSDQGQGVVAERVGD